jgi:hypothetical protein
MAVQYPYLKKVGQPGVGDDSGSPAPAAAAAPALPQLRSAAAMASPAPMSGPPLPTAIVHPSLAQRFLNGPLPGAPAPGSAMAKSDSVGMTHVSNVLGIPTGSLGSPGTLRPGQAAPDVNPQAAGTRVGGFVRDAAKDLANSQVRGINQTLMGGNAVGNVLSMPARAVTGFGEDVLRGVAGVSPRANAGQPYAGTTAPQLSMPFRQPVVNFVAGGQPGPGAPAVNTINSTTTAAPVGVSAAPKPAAGTIPADNISASNLAAAQKFTGQPINPQTAASVPMGAMVNGKRVFSDGTAGVPQTMSPAAMAQLAQGRSISRADPGALGHALASDGAGGTPTQEQMVAQNVAKAQLTRPVTGFRPSAQMFADADRQAIAMKDPRSAVGIAARNLSVDAQFGSSPQLRRMAADQLTALQAGTDAGGAAAQKAESDQAVVGAQGQNTLANTALEGRNTLANSALQQRTELLKGRAGTSQVTSDGRVAMIDPVNGVATYAKDADGNPVRAQLTRDDSATKRANELQDSMAKSVQALLLEYTKNQQMLPEKDRKPPGAQDMMAWKAQSAMAQGLQPHVNQATGEVKGLINNQWVTL